MIIPKKPFYDWGNSLTPEETPIEKYDEHDSFLLEEEWDITQVEAFLKLNYDIIFEKQLHGTWTDESAWPKNRSWNMFLDWFDWHFSSMVWDIFPDKGIEWEPW